MHEYVRVNRFYQAGICEAEKKWDDQFVVNRLLLLLCTRRRSATTPPQSCWERGIQAVIGQTLPRHHSVGIMAN